MPFCLFHNKHKMEIMRSRKKNMNVVEKRKNWENKVSWYKKMRRIQHRNLLPTEHISLMSYLKK